MLNNNLLATIITFVLAVLWLRMMDFIAQRGWISSKLSRKLIHIGTGPIFVVCWLLFDDSPESRWLAALIPTGITMQFILVGLGFIQDEPAIKAMTRTGDRREILRGPLYYGIVFVLLTLVFWKETPVGIIALMLMCGGDGLADLVGRKFPILYIPWSREKSFGGSLAVFLGGLILSALVLNIYIKAEIFSKPFIHYLPGVVVIGFFGTLIESLPFKDIDNITVSLIAILVGLLVF